MNHLPLTVTGSELTVFADRADAGARLVGPVRAAIGDGAQRVHVLGLARGGVAVAAEVARGLGAPLDAWLVKKVGAPGRDELGIGAVGQGGAFFVDDTMAEAAGADDDYIATVLAQKRTELMEQAARLGVIPLRLAGTVVVVDDGAANGVTARVAVRDVKQAGATDVVVALPVAARDAIRGIASEGARVVCLAPLVLGSVGAHYDDFTQVEDDEVRALLTR